MTGADTMVDCTMQAGTSNGRQKENSGAVFHCSESSWLDEISGSGSSQRTWSCSNAHNTQQFREQLTGWDLWQWQLTADMILQQCTQHTTVQRAADWMRSLVVAAHSGHDPAAMHTTHNNYNSFVSKAISHCILMQILSLYDILSTIC